MNELMLSVFAIGIGLLLGSVLPAEIMARRRGVDIRNSGDGNPGTVNAVRTLGWIPGLLTAVYDVSVGIIAIRIAAFLGVPEGVGYVAGIATIVGHRAPVFRGLRDGGQGMAASAGLLVYGIGVALTRGWLSAADIAVLLVVLAIAFAWLRSGPVAAVAMLPLLVAELLITPADWPFVAFMAVVAGYIWATQVPAARRAFASRTVRASRNAMHQ